MARETARKSLFARIGSAALDLMGRRPPEMQVAALCLRENETTGRDEVLLITSLDTGRWVIPKGWPMRGRSLAGAAQREAWEEAGVVGAISREAIGSYIYLKRKRGMTLRVEVQVFPLRVRKMDQVFEEAGKRELRWFTPGEAARQVEEPGLARILTALEHQR